MVSVDEKATLNLNYRAWTAKFLSDLSSCVKSVEVDVTRAVCMRQKAEAERSAVCASCDRLSERMTVGLAMSARC